MEKRPLPPNFTAGKIRPVDLPRPSAYADLRRPAMLVSPPVSARTRWFERKRVLMGLGIAAAFHISLGLAWWLTPPLRLKAGIDPNRWVPVVSVPKADPVRDAARPDAARPDAASEAPAPPAKPVPAKRRAHTNLVSPSPATPPGGGGQAPDGPS